MPELSECPLFALKLLRAGPDRLHVMAEVRSARPDLTLKDAKTLVDGAPRIVKTNMVWEEVERLKRRFADLALVEVVKADGTPLRVGPFAPQSYAEYIASRHR